MSDGPDERRSLLECETSQDREQRFGEVFALHRERLKHVVDLRLDPRIRTRVDSSDIVQDTYMVASRRLGEYLDKAEMPLYLWLRFLAVQTLQDAHRRHLGTRARDARREVHLSRDEPPAATSDILAKEFVARSSTPSDAALRVEKLQQLHEALDRMEPLDREILALRHFEQLSSAEAALVIGVNKEAARRRYYRALERLRSILGPFSGEVP